MPVDHCKCLKEVKDHKIELPKYVCLCTYLSIFLNICILVIKSYRDTKLNWEIPI